MFTSLMLSVVCLGVAQTQRIIFPRICKFHSWSFRDVPEWMNAFISGMETVRFRGA